MTYVLDTSIAIHLRDGDALISERIGALEGAILLSIITKVELEGGVYRQPSQAVERRVRLDKMLRALPVIAFDDLAAEAYRHIVEVAGYSRRKLLDRMIAAQALAVEATLITCNGQDFRDVPGLQLLEW